MTKHRLASLTLVALTLAPAALDASDHADPLNLGTIFARNLEPGLTGLFVFPDGDRMAVILATRRALTQPPPYHLAEYEYRIHFDLHSEISTANPANNARFGGTVGDPTDIAEDASIRIRMNDDASAASITTTGALEGCTGIESTTGVFDDPFIFPRFFQRNVIAMIFTIPQGCFAGREDLVVWGTSWGEGWFGRDKQIDHVGRSNRSQVARLDLLNTLHPSEHAAALQERRDNPPLLLRLAVRLMPFKALYDYLFAIRHYEIVPDVLLYSAQRPPGYPNGRMLTDDVAWITCQWGDCVLQEFSYAEGMDFPRRTTNDKEFRPGFPYLADPC